jgi:hypothetical protein
VFPDGRLPTSGGGWDEANGASHAGSLKFVIPDRSGAGASGSWRIDFSQFVLEPSKEPLTHVYIQWRQKFDSRLLSTKFTDSGGFKQLIVGESDVHGRSETGSCSNTEIVVQNTYQRGFPQLYHSCGRYAPFEQSIKNSDIKMQNGPRISRCLYSNHASGSSDCFRYVADEWMTFQLHVATGAPGEAFDSLSAQTRRGYINSIVQLWGAREGEASVLLHNWHDVVLELASDSATPFGKVWLLPYQTGKSASQLHVQTYTWYDDLIVSTRPIADPDTGKTPTGASQHAD